MTLHSSQEQDDETGYAVTTTHQCHQEHLLCPSDRLSIENKLPSHEYLTCIPILEQVFDDTKSTKMCHYFH